MAESNVPSRQSESPGIQNREGPHAMRRGWPGTSVRRDLFSASPWAMMRRLNEEFDRAFNSAFSFPGSRNQSEWMPAIDVAERNGEIQIHADLPGMHENDVKIEVENDMLNISGERKQEHEEESDGMRRIERSYGRFFRSIPIPEGANIEQAKASFHNGVLEVHIPMEAKQQSARQIPIQSGQGSQSNVQGNATQQTYSGQQGTSGKQTGSSTQSGGSQNANDDSEKIAENMGAKSADPASLGKEIAHDGGKSSKAA